MDKLGVFCCQLIVLGAVTCFSHGLMLDYNWPDPDPNIIHFPHETSCQHYYLVLSEEDVEIRRCQDGYIFDYVVHKCSRRESARCWSRRFGKITHHHIAKKHKKHFMCPYPWGKYPDINDCSKYFLCLSNKAKHKKCAPFEDFDKIERKCIARIDAVCADETDVIEHGYKCPKKWGSFPFSKDCSKYYQCLERKPVLSTCEHDQLFDGKRRKCLPKEEANCGPRRNSYEQETTVASTIAPTRDIARMTSDAANDGSVELVRDMTKGIPPADRELSPSTNPPPASKTELEINTESVTEKIMISLTKGWTATDDSEVESSSVHKSTSKENGDGSGLQRHDASSGSTILVKGIEDVSKATDANEFIEVVSSNSHLTETSDLPRNTNDIFTKTTGNSMHGKSEIVNDQSENLKASTANEVDGSSRSHLDIPTNHEESVVIRDKCSPEDSRCVLEKDGSVLRCPAADGFHPHPRNEKLYIHCENYKIDVKSCPGDTIFYPKDPGCIAAMIL